MSQGTRQEVDGTSGTQPEITLFDDEGEDTSGESSRERSGFERVMRAPAVGATVTGAVVLGAAAAFGVLEAAVAAGAAYATYLVLRKRASRPPST
jgi:hypothetical protein